MARSIRKRVEEGAERPCILIGDPLEEACRVVHIFVGCDVRDRSRTHTLELYYPSISLLFSRSPFFFFNTSRHSRTLVPSDTSSSVPPHRVTANRVFEDTRIQG